MNDFETVRNGIRGRPGAPEVDALAALDRIETEVEGLRKQGGLLQSRLRDEKYEVERLRAHSENLGTALLESRAEVEGLRAALESIDQACTHDLVRLTALAPSAMSPADRTRSIQSIARAALAKEEA